MKKSIRQNNLANVCFPKTFTSNRARFSNKTKQVLYEEYEEYVEENNLIPWARRSASKENSSKVTLPFSCKEEERQTGRLSGTTWI